jgi:hypothetical protein
MEQVLEAWQIIGMQQVVELTDVLAGNAWIAA